MVMRKKVFICSPFRGDMEGNARKAAVYSRMVCEQGYLPIAYLYEHREEANHEELVQTLRSLLFGIRKEVF